MVNVKTQIMKQYNINFKGYRRDCNKSTLPHNSGIYMVYRCLYNEQSNTVQLNEIIYIGQAQDLNQRLNNHEKYSEFKAKCGPDEELCYAYADVSLDDLDIIENALIFAQKPPLNSELVDSFNYENASFLVEGRCALLTYTDFTIG